jgi:hypothetical protein
MSTEDNQKEKEYAEGFKLLSTWPRTGDARLLPTGRK